MRTLSTAFGVLAALLGFLFDVAIWLAVVVVPFVFAGWGSEEGVVRDAGWQGGEETGR